LCGDGAVIFVAFDTSPSEVVEMSRVLNFLWALSVGAVALFGFFAVMGGFSPGDVLWLTLIVAFLAVLFVIHQMRVSHELSEHGDEPVLREVQRIRERRGF
jgi:fatty acid desaturase